MNPNDCHSALLKEPDSGKGCQKGKNDYSLIERVLLIDWDSIEGVIFSLRITRAWVVELLSHVWFFATPWTVALPGSSPFVRFSRQVLEWAAVSFSRGSFRPRDRTHISSIVEWILHCWAMRKAPVSLDKRSQIHKVTVKTNRGASRSHFQIPVLIWIHVLLKDKP